MFESLARKLIAIPLLLTTACYEWVPAQPQSAAQLGTGTVQHVGTTGKRDVYAISVQTIQAPDGTLREIKGQFDLRVTTTNGGSMTFEHPVRIDKDGENAMVIAGKNRAPTRLTFAEIRSLEISQYDEGATTLASLGIGFAAAGAVYLLLRP